MVAVACLRGHSLRPQRLKSFARLITFDRRGSGLSDPVGGAPDGPARAIRAAQSIRDASNQLGVEVRAGLHTGECELVGDDVAGLAVHIGARVMGLAGASEVLTSSTVKDLVAGSEIEFGDRGERAARRARALAAVQRRAGRPQHRIRSRGRTATLGRRSGW